MIEDYRPLGDVQRIELLERRVSELERRLGIGVITVLTEPRRSSQMSSGGLVVWHSDLGDPQMGELA